MKKTASNIREVVVADLRWSTTTTKQLCTALVVDTKSDWASPSKQTDCPSVFNDNCPNLPATW